MEYLKNGRPEEFADSWRRIVEAEERASSGPLSVIPFRRIHIWRHGAAGSGAAGSRNDINQAGGFFLQKGG